MSLFRYLLFLFGWKEINPFRCKEFKKFIKQNKIKWQKKIILIMIQAPLF